MKRSIEVCSDKVNVKRRAVRANNKVIRSLQSVERKFFDQELNAVASSSTGVFTSLLGGLAASGDGVARGTGPSERIGTLIFISDILINLKLLQSARNSSENGLMRVMLLCDTQCNGAVPTLAEVLETTGAQDTLAHKNLANTERFRVLYDESFVLAPGAAGGGDSTIVWGETTKMIKYDESFKNPIRVTYKTDNSDGEVDGIITNNIWLVNINQNGATDKIAMKARVRYTG